MRSSIVVILLVCSAGAVSAQSTFHGDVARTGVFEETGPLRSPSVRWSFQAEGPFVASPVVAGGKVFVGSVDRRLYAIDADTGAEVWNFESRMPIASTATVVDGTLYFVSGTGALAALDASDGTPRWVFAGGDERRFAARNLHGTTPAGQLVPDSWDLFVSSPAVADGMVVYGGGDGNVYAVDASTGVLQWMVPTGDVVHASPAVAAGTVYVGSFDSIFYAIDLRSGRLVWTFEAGRDPVIHNQEGFQGSAAVVDGTVYVGCRDAHVYALDAATGEVRWSHPTSKSWVIGTPVVYEGVVYVGTSDSARFMALDAETGRLRFDYDAKAYVFSSAALAGDLLYVGSHNGRVHAIDRRTGTAVWQFATQASQADPRHVLLDDGSLDPRAFAPVFRDHQDMVLDLDRFRSVGAVVSSPVVAGGRLFVSSMDGRVYALE